MKILLDNSILGQKFCNSLRRRIWSVALGSKNGLDLCPSKDEFFFRHWMKVSITNSAALWKAFHNLPNDSVEVKNEKKVRIFIENLGIFGRHEAILDRLEERVWSEVETTDLWKTRSPQKLPRIPHQVSNWICFKQQRNYDYGLAGQRHLQHCQSVPIVSYCIRYCIIFSIKALVIKLPVFIYLFDKRW